jgi:hypothetical protein
VIFLFVFTFFHALQYYSSGDRAHVGQNGKALIQLEDGIEIQVKDSYAPNNNGTGLYSGQIPRFIFRKPPVIVEEDTKEEEVEENQEEGLVDIHPLEFCTLNDAQVRKKSSFALLVALLTRFRDTSGSSKTEFGSSSGIT